MSEKRQWDESRSPQWRYLLGKESAERRDKEKRREQAEGELKRGVSKRKRLAQERHREKRKLKSKSGREIIYTASPGGKWGRWQDEDYVANKNTNKSKKQNDNI